VKITSYNVNGVRSALTKGLDEYLAAHPSDILCLQETKAHQSDVPAEVFQSCGFQHAHWHSAQKKGYSGVATFSKTAPDKVVHGCGIEAIDAEGRILRTDFGDLTLLNCYFPSGTTGDLRQAFKMVFLADFARWVDQLRRERPNLVVLGDFNIAHTEIDIHDPKGNKKTSGFLPEERAWMTDWLANGFVDAFRFCHPDQVIYSWWTFRANARANNKGWRIDYQMVAKEIAPNIRDAGYDNGAAHSDHCPIWLELEF